MRRERIGSLIPLTSIVVCSLLVAFSPAGNSCFPMLWRCYEHSLLFQALFSAALLPLLAGVPGGLYAGIRQAMRTYGVVKQLQTLPQTEQPLSITCLAHTLHITDQVDLIDDFRPEAFCYGFLKPRICLTTGLLRALTDAEVESVLHHEYQHLKRRDPLRALFWTVLDNACWWQEKSGELAQLHRELAADRGAIAACGRKPLASALLKLLNSPESNEGVRSGLAMSSLSVTEARIEQLLYPERPIVPAVPNNGKHLFPVMTMVIMLMCVVVIQ
jgi:Zn-dependent protease with chaperone function